MRSKYSQLRHLRHFNATPIIKRLPEENEVYYKIARHYGWAFSEVFGDPQQYQYAIVLEDDLEVSIDFFDYMALGADALELDHSLWTVTAWNDNGIEGRADDETAIYRSDFFGGLGWIMTRKIWEELGPRWPATTWDEWMRERAQRRGRACLRPEVSRTVTFGRIGSSYTALFDSHLSRMKLNTKKVNFSGMRREQFIKRIYDTVFLSSIAAASEITLDLVEELPSGSIAKLVYESYCEFSHIAKYFGLMADMWSEVPRVSYQGIVTFRLPRAKQPESEHSAGVLIHIAPSNIDKKSKECLLLNPDVAQSPQWVQGGGKNQIMQAMDANDGAIQTQSQTGDSQVASQMTYEEAIESASKGIIDNAIIEAIKSELERSQLSPSDHTVNVKINLAVGLLNLGNQAGDLSTYERLYRESELILLSVLKSHPGHNGAAQNLGAVQRNWRKRKAQDIPAPVQEKMQHSCSNSIFDEFGMSFVSGDRGNTMAEPALTYSEALQKAMTGLTDSRVIEAMKQEHLLAVESGAIEHSLNVKVNLAVALMQRGLHFVSHPAAHPVIAQRCFKYSENILLSALKLDPNHKSVKGNLVSLRQNIQNLFPVDDLTIYAEPSDFLTSDKSYENGLRNAMLGIVDSSVLQSMRDMHSRMAKNQVHGHDLYDIVNVKVNLGVALLERVIYMIDQPVGIRICDSYQQEAEELFLSSLVLDPGNYLAAKNLHLLRVHGRFRMKSSLLVGNHCAPKLDRHLQPVYATLTTIPPRMSKDLRLAIDSLLPQVDHVFLSVSDSYSRFGGSYELPSYLKEEPYSSHVTVTSGPDYGAPTKYLGSLQAMPKKGWVFVGDDDQVYKEDIIQRMMNSVTRLGAYQNSDRNVRFKSTSMSDLITGFWGVIFPLELLQNLATFPVPHGARLVDDQWMSIYCLFHGIPVYLTELDQEKDIFKFQKNTGSHGLLEAGNKYTGRADYIRSMESFFGVYLGSIYPTYHRLDVHLNLGIALLRLAVDNTNNVMCQTKALESEKILQFALTLHPGNQRVQKYLDAAQSFKDKCTRSRSDADAGPNYVADMLPTDTFESDISVSYFPNLSPISIHELETIYQRATIFKNALKSKLFKANNSSRHLSKPALSYSDALQQLWTKSVQGMPGIGTVTENVLDALRYEQLDVELMVRRSRYTLLVINLGVSLYSLASAADATMPSLSSQLYLESADMFETVLQMQPHNALAVDSLARARAKLNI